MPTSAALTDDPRLFWDHVLVGDDCWEWTGAVGAGDYGSVWLDGRKQYAHRVAWQAWHGNRPASAVYHSCGTRLCCRPDHLQLSRKTRPVDARFWEKVNKTGGCWEWTGARYWHGYGVFNHADTSYAHRVAWMLERGPIPEGLELDHLCKNKLCVRPGHLEPVTHVENVQRAGSWWRAQTHCKNGHEYTEETTLWWRGNRRCLICKRAAARRYNARRRGR